MEYSTFGSNEDLYNQLTLGNDFDLVCPSEYMFMKLIAEERLQPLSEGFFDTETEENYYARGVSGYIKIYSIRIRSTASRGANMPPGTCGGPQGSSITRRK